MNSEGVVLGLPCSVTLSKALSVPPKVQVTEKAMVPCRHESKLIYWMLSSNSTKENQFVRVTKPIYLHLELPLFISSKSLLQLLGSNHLNFKRGGGVAGICFRAWILFFSHDAVFLLVYITIRNIVK